MDSVFSDFQVQSLMYSPLKLGSVCLDTDLFKLNRHIGWIKLQEECVTVWQLEDLELCGEKMSSTGVGFQFVVPGMCLLIMKCHSACQSL